MTAPPVILSASDCESLIPESWQKPVPSAPLPTKKTVGQLGVFGDAQTGQLDVANLHITGSHEIHANCEKLQKKAADELKPKPWWHLGIW